MHIAIVHYHLRRGGVSRIIRHAVSSLADQGIETLVITGEPSTEIWESSCRIVPSLAYDRPGGGRSPEGLTRDLETAVRETWGSLPDLWHVHNHSLGKNLAFPIALHHLARSGQRMLLQIHDFPEDGRPDNYRNLIHATGQGDGQRLSSVLYPQAPHIHYAVLNSRDHAILEAAGFSPEHLHQLPNPVWIPKRDHGPHKASSKDGRLWLYPTRAIRRKNLGEFLLWASLADPQDHFATTLAPENPLERPAYERWCEIAKELHLPVRFELGLAKEISFESLLESAHALVTTSVAEGFGMAFLEPWLAWRAVSGRNLPEITEEFEQAGVDLSRLYKRLEVPVDWIGADVLESKARVALGRTMQAYGRNPTETDIRRVLSAWIQAGTVDFGRLDEHLQEDLIVKINRDRVAREELSPARLPEPASDEKTLTDNREAILKHFGLKRYGHHLRSVYEQIIACATEPLEAIPGESLLDQFLAPERLYLLRSG